MLKESYELIKELKDRLSFEHNTAVMIDNDILLVQIFFRKDDVPYYFTQPFTQAEINDTNNEDFLIGLFINSLEEFYIIANTEDFEESELINQTIITRKGDLKCYQN